jgi:outer membrane protein assembly factor BamB
MEKGISARVSFFSQYDNVLSGNGAMILGRTDQHKFVAFDIANGTNVFTTHFGEEQGLYSRDPLLLTSNEAILENNGKLKFFNTTTGQSTRIISIPNVFLVPVLVSDKYLLASGNEHLYVYAPEIDEQYVDPDGDVPLEEPPSPNPTENEKIYVVQAGDLLWKISSQFGTTIPFLVERNRLDSNHHLWVGQNIIVPKPQKVYIVQSGDSLWKIEINMGCRSYNFSK